MVHNMHRHPQHHGHPRLYVQLYVEGELDYCHRGYGRGCEQNQELDNAGSEIRMEQVSSERSTWKFLLGLHSYRVARYGKQNKTKSNRVELMRGLLRAWYSKFSPPLSVEKICHFSTSISKKTATAQIRNRPPKTKFTVLKLGTKPDTTSFLHRYQWRKFVFPQLHLVKKTITAKIRKINFTMLKLGTKPFFLI